MLESRAGALVGPACSQSALNQQRAGVQASGSPAQDVDRPLGPRCLRPALGHLDQRVQHQCQPQPEGSVQLRRRPLRRRAQNGEPDQRRAAEGHHHGEDQLRQLLHPGADELGHEEELERENAQRGRARAQPPDVDGGEDQQDEHHVRDGPVRRQCAPGRHDRQRDGHSGREGERLVAWAGFGDRDRADHRREGACHEDRHRGVRHGEDAEGQQHRADCAQR